MRVEDFPFPCVLILMECDFDARVASIFYGLSDEGLARTREEALVLILPTAEIPELKEIAIAFYQTLSEEVTSNALLSIGGIAKS